MSIVPLLVVASSLVGPAAGAGTVGPVAAWDFRKGTNDHVSPVARLLSTVGSPEATADGLLFHGEGTDGLVYTVGPRRKLASTDGFTLWVRAAFRPAINRRLANHDTLVSRWGVRGEYAFLLKCDDHTGTLTLVLSPDGKGILGYDSGYQVDRSGAFHDLAVTVKAGRDVAFYVDGKPVSRLTYPALPKKLFDPPGEKAPFAIGYNSDSAPGGDHESMNGTIQVVRMYSGALGPEVIARLSEGYPEQPAAAGCSLTVDATQAIGPVHPYVFGQFLEHYQDCVYGGVYAPKSPQADRDGFRSVVMLALKSLRPTVIRWPGGNFASAYNWRLGAGPQGSRQAISDPVWHQAEPNTFGTPEFVTLCRRVGAEPLICVGVGRDPRSPKAEDAAAWVRYCNATSGPEAELRKASGHPEPFNVLLWGLGNEPYGDWQVGYYKDARQYAEDVVRYASAMRQADPRIKLVVCGDSYKGDNTLWNRAVLTDDVVRLGEWMSWHSYTHLGAFGPRLPHQAVSSRLAQVERDLEALAKVNREVSAKPGRAAPVQVAVDEWNEFGWGDQADNSRPEVYDLADALFTAGFLNTMLRHADAVTLANYSTAVNGRGLIAASDKGVVRRTAFHVFEMYRPLAGGMSVPVKLEAPTLDGSAAPVLDAAAVRDADGGLCLCVVNRNVMTPIGCKVSLKGFSAERAASRVLTAGTLAAYNSLEQPEAVTPKDRRVDAKGSAFTAVFAPRSVTLLRLTAAQASQPASRSER
jgi:alpha-L-arabinofuranosidase